VAHGLLVCVGRLFPAPCSQFNFKTPQLEKIRADMAILKDFVDSPMTLEVLWVSDPLPGSEDGAPVGACLVGCGRGGVQGLPSWGEEPLPSAVGPPLRDGDGGGERGRRGGGRM
jgi:hypothetical protein